MYLWSPFRHLGNLQRMHGVGYRALFKPKHQAYSLTQGHATYLHGDWAGHWEVRGLDMCPEGWGSLRLCEGQSRSLSCGANIDQLAPVTVFLAPMPSSARKKTSWAGQGTAQTL